MDELSNFGLIKAFCKMILKRKLTRAEAEYTELYASMFMDSASKGSLVPVNNLAGDEIQLSSGFIGTRGFKKKLFAITKIDSNYTGNLPLELKHTILNAAPSTEVIVQQISIPVGVNMKTFIRNHASAKKYLVNYEKAFNSLSPAEQITGVQRGSTKISSQNLEQRREEVRSFETVDRLLRNRRSITSTFIILQVITPITKELESMDSELQFPYLTALDTFSTDNRIKLTEIKDIGEFLYSYSPTNIVNARRAQANINSVLLTSENYATSINDQHGVEGDSGTDYGVLEENSTPFRINHKEAPTAQIVLVVGRTGSGKSEKVKLIEEDHISKGDMLDVVDYKGTEHIHLKDIYKYNTTVVNFDDGVFVNTLNFSSVSNPSTSLYDSSIEITKSVLYSLIDLTVEEENEYGSQIEKLLKTSIILYLTKCGVKRNVLTFSKSQSCSYQGLWNHFTQNIYTSEFYRLHFAKALDRINVGLFEFFDAHGTSAYKFSKEIDVSKVLNSQCVVYSLNKLNNTGIPKADVAVAYSYVFFISSLRTVIAKQLKKFPVLVFEELQEAKSDLAFLKSLQAKITLSRSFNTIMYMILNNFAMFEKADSEIKEASEALASILASFTTICVGEINPNDIELLDKMFKDKPKLIELVKECNREDFTNEEASYKFAVVYNSGKKKGYGIVCNYTPESYKSGVAEKLYTTRNVEEVIS